MENGRFVVKYNNGFWKAFDTVSYKDMELFRLETDAIEKVASVNERIAREQSNNSVST